MYTIFFTPTAEKSLFKLEKNMQVRIIATLDRIKFRPHAFVLRLAGSRYFRLRVGDYRIILDIQQERLLIIVIELGHRKNIYKG